MAFNAIYPARRKGGDSTNSGRSRSRKPCRKRRNRQARRRCRRRRRGTRS